MKKTKIVCTLGPASENKDTMRKMALAGMNVARLNFSHGDYEEQGARIKTIRELNQEDGLNIGILLDTKGPEIRTHDFENGKTDLVKGETILVSMTQVLGTAKKFSISYTGLINDVKIGGQILLDDGLIALEVIGFEGDCIVCKILNNGPIKNKKGVNVPNISLSMDFISPKDKADIEYACSQDLDYIAASFVRRANDVREIREILKAQGNTHIQIISKIENQEGVDNLDEILELSDGIMVARGDLGVEVPAEEVPVIQKLIVKKCNKAGKVVIVATQMLDSMQKNPRPTRAEVSDVINAVFDGTDAIMLSGETAAGDYPVETVQIMAKIASRGEDVYDYETYLHKAKKSADNSITTAIAFSTAKTLLELDIKCVIAATESGYTARAVSNTKPRTPIIAITNSERTLRNLALFYGVYPVVVNHNQSFEDIVLKGVEACKQLLDVHVGDLVAITAGLPSGQTASTNTLKIHEIK